MTTSADNDKHRARIFLHRGDLAHARACYEDAVRADRHSGNRDGLYESLGNLGNVCAMMGDTELRAAGCRGSPMFGRSRTGSAPAAAGSAVPHSIVAPASLGILYSNLALVATADDDAQAAVQHFQRALEYHRRIGNEEGLAITYGQLGKLFLSIGDDRQAERCLNNASEHFIKLGDGRGEAGALRLLADLYEQCGDLVFALRCAERIRVVLRRCGSEPTDDDAIRLERLQARRAAGHSCP